MFQFTQKHLYHSESIYTENVKTATYLHFLKVNSETNVFQFIFFNFGNSLDSDLIWKKNQCGAKYIIFFNFTILLYFWFYLIHYLYLPLHLFSFLFSLFWMCINYCCGTCNVNDIRRVYFRDFFTRGIGQTCLWIQLGKDSFPGPKQRINKQNNADVA